MQNADCAVPADRHLSTLFSGTTGGSGVPSVGVGEPAILRWADSTATQYWIPWYTTY